MTKVFLVDDEIVIREGIRTSFPWEETDYVLVGEAPDGEMALPMIRDTKPDILITDIRMPFMDGMELCRAVRSQMPWIGIIILSGYDEFEYARRGIRLGVKEYMLKPVTAEELRAALDRVREGIRAEREERERKRAEGPSGADGAFLREKLLSALYLEDAAEADAEGVVRQLRGLGVSIAAPRYVVLDAAWEPLEEGRKALWELTGDGGGFAFASASRTGARVLVLGDNDEDAEERAYAFANSAGTELQRAGCRDIRLSIGEIVDRPQDIVRSLRSARHIRHVLADQKSPEPVIVGVREFSETSGNRSAAVTVAKAKLYLSQHFSESSLMLQDVAAAVNMSNSHFSTLFSQESGRTFTEYLTSLRVERAKELLRTTAKRSSEIGFEVGYNDAHYFSYLFRKTTGMTPSEYRQQNENEPE